MTQLELGYGLYFQVQRYVFFLDFFVIIYKKNGKNE